MARTTLARFVAGGAAVLTVHQTAVWALHHADVVPWTAYSFAPTRPLGVPAVLSAAFWGGVWWVGLAPAIVRAATPAGSAVRAAALGAVLPTAVGALLVAAGHAMPRGNARPATLLGAGLVVNAAWGLAAWALMRALDATPRRQSPDTGPRSARRSPA